MNDLVFAKGKKRKNREEKIMRKCRLSCL